MMAQKIPVLERNVMIAKLLSDRALMMLAVWLSLSVATCGGAEAEYKHNDLHGKLIVGFQGWFMCPNDGRGTGTGYTGLPKIRPTKPTCTSISCLTFMIFLRANAARRIFKPQTGRLSCFRIKRRPR